MHGGAARGGPGSSRSSPRAVTNRAIGVTIGASSMVRRQSVAGFRAYLYRRRWLRLVRVCVEPTHNRIPHISGSGASTPHRPTTSTLTTTTAMSDTNTGKYWRYMHDSEAACQTFVMKVIAAARRESNKNIRTCIEDPQTVFDNTTLHVSYDVRAWTVF